MKINNTGTRARIEILKEKRDMDGIASVKGIEMVERRNPNEDKNLDYTCFKHLCIETGFNCRGPIESWPGISEGELVEVQKPQEGDIVVYFDSKRESQRSRHVGTYIRRGIIKSKWGHYHIYEHDIDCVPPCYGNTVRFFRKASTTSPV